MLELPRSARLAAWGTAVLAGTADPGEAEAAITGDDEPHAIAGPDADHRGVPRAPVGAGLRELFGLLAADDVVGLRVVLPAPGDVLGLPGPPEFNGVALEAGECVLMEHEPGAGRVPWAVVPEVTEFGSVYEPGALVVWRLHPVRPRRVTDFGSVAEADRELRTALDEATRELDRLDVARWREDAADLVSAIRDGGLARGTLPPSTPPRCVRVLATAARVRAIVALASEDDGAAVTSFESTRRARTLRDLESVSRRAVVAAVNGLLEPG